MDSMNIQKAAMTTSSNVAATTNSKPTTSGLSISKNSDNYGNVDGDGNADVKDGGAAGDGTNTMQNTKSLLTTSGSHGESSYNNKNNGVSVPNSATDISPGKYQWSSSFPNAGASPYSFKTGRDISTFAISGNVNTAGAAGGGDAPYLVGSGSAPFAGAVAAGDTIYPKFSEYSEENTTVNKASVAQEQPAVYSRKVFVGGLPPDISEEEIINSFKSFGPLVVDWPHKITSQSEFPPKGYAFLIFQDEISVQRLIQACITDQYKWYLCISSTAIKDKPVEIRPWRLTDGSYVLDTAMPLDPRKTVFIGGVPRPLKAYELAMIIHRIYGGVCFASIDTDPELKYPKGAARVAFSNKQSYIAALSSRFVQLQHGDFDKRVEVKPFVLGNQMCDECQGQLCGGKYAPFFCTNISCLKYYCGYCWAVIHARPGREYHKPFVKEGSDRSRSLQFRRY